MSGSGRETLPAVREWWEPSWMSRSPARSSGNGLDTLLDVAEGWEALPYVRQLSGGPP